MRNPIGALEDGEIDAGRKREVLFADTFPVVFVDLDREVSERRARAGIELVDELVVDDGDDAFLGVELSDLVGAAGDLDGGDVGGGVAGDLEAVEAAVELVGAEGVGGGEGEGEGYVSADDGLAEAVVVGVLWPRSAKVD
ncbi:hypothetical protein Acr_00g0024980 [Actinidia rufa]|uniref:Uncharacterized protein n=1 Tax=Actinidia rufa TaxID=165716 RepID=A0A7J0DDR8_9ERIC|nr:hypothetical protein Acr_00g0024980 [Actinidia rufa]